MQCVVDHLSVARGGVPVLSDVSFTIDAGQALILRGPNGSGKTTLLRTIAGLQPALSGQVTAPEDSIAYAAHADGLKAMLTVAENLQFWAQIFGQSGIDDALNAFHLENLRTRFAGTLSAGQKRRLGLARLLVTGRKFWVLDEPTVSMDSVSVTYFAETVRQHLNAGGLALIATHIDLGLDASVFDVKPYRARQDVLLGTSDEAFL